MGIRDRLGRLEQLVLTDQGEAAKGAEKSISKEVLRRITDDELRTYVSVLRRMREGEEPGEEDKPILRSGS
jgi:hypothetical protein